MPYVKGWHLGLEDWCRRMTRIHVAISDEILEAIVRRVGARGRSRFVEEAAREKLDRENLDRLGLEQALRDTAGVARGRRAKIAKDVTRRRQKAGPSPWSGVDLVREDRDR